MKIVFDTDSTPTKPFVEKRKNSNLTKLLIKFSGGMIKSENAANILLIVFAILVIILSIYLIHSSITPEPAEPILSPYDQ